MNRQGIVEMARFCKLCTKRPDKFDVCSAHVKFLRFWILLHFNIFFFVFDIHLLRFNVIMQSCGIGDVIATSFGG